MKPVLVLWLLAHGWPASWAPDYAMMVGLATIIASAIVLRQAERDGARVDLQARAILCAYGGALIGGYLFEWIRMIPTAISERSLDPIVFAGRAAYGGLVFGALAPILYLRRKKAPFTDFLDRATLGMGIMFAFVRFGCFLEGCDFGRPTSSLLGVRFPAGSEAANAHVLAGWIPAGAPSLPVHPTELYESAIGLLATAIALIPLYTPEARVVGAAPRPRRDGTAFATWLTVYAIGRFLNELLRGDVERGHYATLSTAQWVSIAILMGVAIFKTRRVAIAAVAACVFCMLWPTPADAQVPTPDAPATAPTEPAPPAATPEPPKAAPVPAPAPEKKPVLYARLGLASSFTMARPDVPSGFAEELDAMYRFWFSDEFRLDLGLEGRHYANVEATHWSLGVIAELALVGGKHFEMLFTFVPHETWFVWDSNFFNNTNAYGLRYALGAQFPFGPVVFGATPLAFTTTSSATVGVIQQWEPRVWAGVTF